MKIYATSDTHFGHDRLVELSGRPDDFSARLLRSISQNSGDLLIHCGDFCIGNDGPWVAAYMDAAKRFKKKVLVRGNHDKKSDSWYIKHGFDLVCDQFPVWYFGKYALFTHIPVIGQVKVDRNIHGHLHGNQHRHEIDYYDPKYHFDLAPELHDYKILNLANILTNK